MGKNGIAEAVYDDSNGNAGQINGLTRFPVLVTPHGQGKAVFLFESRDLFSRVFVFLTQGDKGNPVAVFFIGFVQIRKFMLARSAPGRPEIDQHGFVVFQRLAQGERIPICVRHGEIRERLPKKGSVERLLACAAGAQRRKQHRHAKDQCCKPAMVFSHGHLSSFNPGLFSAICHSSLSILYHREPAAGKRSKRNS